MEDEIKVEIEEKPDLLKYEDEFDVITVKPSAWEVTITEKETGEQFDLGEYDTKEEGREVMMKEIDSLNQDMESDELMEDDSEKMYTIIANDVDGKLGKVLEALKNRNEFLIKNIEVN